MKKVRQSLPMDLHTARTSRRGFLLASGGAAALSVLGGSSIISIAQAQSATFDYYIGPNGSDSNAGTMSSPWALTAINSKRSLYAGKRVGLLDGVYDVLAIYGSYNNLSYSSCALNIAGGTAASPTVIAAVNQLGAVLDARANASNNPGGSSVIGSSNSYVTIDGLEIKNCYYQAMRFTNSLSFTGTGVPGIVVRNCYIHDITNETLGSANPCAIQSNNLEGALFSNIRIDNCTSFDNRMSGYIFWSAHNTVVEYNSIFRTNIGVHFKNTNNTNNTIRNCYIDMSTVVSGQKVGIKLDSTATSGSEKVYNNVIIGDNCYDGDMFPIYNDDFHFYNNTLIGIPNWSTAGVKLFLGANNVGTYFYNNIFSRGSVGYRGDASLTSGGIALCDYNCWPGSPVMVLYPPGSGGTAVSTSRSLAQIRTNTGQDAGSIASNEPGFVGSGVEAEYYKLTANAAANVGRVGGLSSGQPTQMGAWGNGATRVGSSVTFVRPSVARSVSVA
jgi:hypothetical protein